MGRRLNLVADQSNVVDDDAEFARQVELRAELVAARLCVAYWQRRIRELDARIRELERELPASNPLRGVRIPDA